MPIPASEFIELRQDFNKLIRLIDEAILAQAPDDKVNVSLKVPKISYNLQKMISDAYQKVGWNPSFQTTHDNDNTMIGLIARPSYKSIEEKNQSTENPQ